MIRFRSSATLLALVALSGFSPVGTAQSLRGSMASVDRMYDHAVQDGLTFYETTNAVHWAAARGELVQLHSDHGYAMRGVAFLYVRPATLTFVDLLAEDYERVCEEPL